MLEIKHVTKVYKTKGGVDTKALDDVSISFGETGLVFLLGKSGSGKSTLLNVCGGLDEPTSGEVIVKGKSSKDFSGSDFDSYRNTFVGFIFQEYNVLDEFNVEDNIALALELQGKPKDKQKIADLLKEVDLESFAKRKPNTLSGGQKQRIAIARALIKEPQIIMADEPTGALDSATGKQVFDTLKKLSMTRLVIVVSHDREFAEIYGDRIVELKDGKIISDVTKAEVPPQTIDENVTVIGGSTLSIKSGSKLTKQNIKAIQDFVLSCEGDVIVTKGEKEISSFRKANRMTDVGATETFNETKPDEIVLKEYSKEDSKFIRSRLPAGKAVKIGASGLKLKPVRLVFTILLSFIAFTMFGLFSTLMLYDGNSVAVNSFTQSDYDYLNVTKQYYLEETYTNEHDSWTSTGTRDTKFSAREVNEFAQKYGNSTFGYFSARYDKFLVDNISVKSGKSEYYNNGISKLAYVPSGHSVRNGIIGNYPAKPDEICISSYLAEVMNKENSSVDEATVNANGNVSYEGGKLTINSAQDIVGKYIVIPFGGTRLPFKVTGVFDSGNIASKFDGLKDSSNETNFMLSFQYSAYLSDGMFQLALVSEDFYGTYENFFSGSDDEYKSYFEYYENNLTYKTSEYTFNTETGELEVTDNSYQNNMNNSINPYGGDNQLKTYFFGSTDKNSLDDNEMVLGIEYLNIVRYPIMQYFISQIKSGAYDNDERLKLPAKLSESDITYDDWDVNKENGYYEIEGWGNYYTYEDYLTKYNWIYNNTVGVFLNTLCDDFYQAVQKYNRGEYYRQGYYDEDGNWVEGENVTVSNAERIQALEEIVKVLINIQPFDLEITIDETRTLTCKVVGFHEADISTDYGDSRYGLYLSQNIIDSYLKKPKGQTTVTVNTKYVEEEGSVYTGVFVAYDRSEKSINNILASIGIENRTSNDVVYYLQNSLYSSIDMANDMAETLSTVFLWVGVVFAVFSALLMFNFISVSISSKRKEIGILRAVGARGVDVFKIFFSEAGIITGICTVLALIGAFVGCWLINGILKTEVGLDVTLFVFGIASVGMMIGIAVLVAFIATFLPVYFASRKKPVESIRAL